MNNIKRSSVVVLMLSYNGKELLGEAITSYQKNNYSNFKIVLIDNGSNDNTNEYVNDKFPNVDVIRTEKNLGYSGGFNFGLDYTFSKYNPDYVLITNNDVKADSNLISSLVNVADSNEKVGFVVGKVMFYDQPDTFQIAYKTNDPVSWQGKVVGFMEKDHGQHDITKEVAWCDDIYWLTTREVYEKTKGYDTQFKFQAEDWDWQVRVKKLGYKIYYTYKAKLWHKYSATIGTHTPLRAYYDSRNYIILHMKHREFNEFKPYATKMIKGKLKNAFKSLVKLKIKFAYNIFAGLLSALAWGLREKKLNAVKIIQLLF